MRLTESQQKMIAHTTSEIFGADASVTLFGSRTDDSARGGDIDLLISTGLDAETARQRKIRFLTVLKRRIGDRRIDVVLRSPDSEERAIHRIATTEGVPIS
jgi:predicted nucleotidyltransferase